MNASRSLAGGKLFIFKIPEQDREQSTHFFFWFLFSPGGVGATLGAKRRAGRLPGRPCAAFPAPPYAAGRRRPSSGHGAGTKPRSPAAGCRSACRCRGRGREKPGEKEENNKNKSRSRAPSRPLLDGARRGLPARHPCPGTDTGGQPSSPRDGRTDARTTVLPLRPAT